MAGYYRKFVRYDIAIEHIKGRANNVPDPLSPGIAGRSTNAIIEEEKVVRAIQKWSWLEVRLPRHDRMLSTADFVIENDRLKLICEDGPTVDVVPNSKRRDIFNDSHHGIIGGHFNSRKMYA
ncbi:hypothetical protein Aduo_012404 [Ancylostoma duodenale]